MLLETFILLRLIVLSLKSLIRGESSEISVSTPVWCQNTLVYLSGVQPLYDATYYEWIGPHSAKGLATQTLL